ncbi:hypothetical protein ACJMK2_037642 [Sinanodonta woodiana]|uniref:Phosphatidylinositol N-acetylglucosaminyltransferase subunit H conserved domain-containing protein n=1 Tax=Sinanodonta woodiana TaxID=1069815 RepID=A0ABD3WQB3_SINWO
MFTPKYELKHDRFGELGSIFILQRPNSNAANLNVVAAAVIATIAGVLSFTGKVSQLILILGNHLLIFCAVFFGLFIFFFNRKQTESLLILSSLGITITRSGVFRDYSKFVDIAEIDDIVILEVVTMHSVRCQLVVMLKEDNMVEKSKILPIFQKFQPRTEDLRIIYKDAQAKLFNQFSRKR